MHELPVRLSVNGRSVEEAVEPRVTLADFLRETCGLTGTHLGCEHGRAGLHGVAGRPGGAVVSDLRGPGRRPAGDHGRGDRRPRW
ncbi:putative aerobic-type carbon monoxide dehydrogenase small subunit [Mycobacterium xenopi 3993]|nr:putative aerobic-type carbon monoxide dehydrogenase small subunit [Mycobacterium xenopi 3993]